MRLSTLLVGIVMFAAGAAVGHELIKTVHISGARIVFALQQGRIDSYTNVANTQDIRIRELKEELARLEDALESQKAKSEQWEALYKQLHEKTSSAKNQAAASQQP